MSTNTNTIKGFMKSYGDRLLTGTKPARKANNTLVYMSKNGFLVYRLHQTDVVKIGDGIVILDSGGWSTRTTSDRMHNALYEDYKNNRRPVQLRVFIRKGNLMVSDSTREVRLVDGVMYNYRTRTFCFPNDAVEKIVASDSRMTNYMDKGLLANG